MKHIYTVKSIELAHISRKETIRETVTDKDDSEKTTKIVREQVRNVPAFAVALVPDTDTVSAFLVYEEQKGPCSYAVGQIVEVGITPK